MNAGLKKDIKTLRGSFSEYQVIRKAIEKSGTLVTKLSKYYNLILGDEECNEEYYQAIYDTDFDVDIFETKVIDEMAELLIALYVLMLSMDSKKRVQEKYILLPEKFSAFAFLVFYFFFVYYFLFYYFLFYYLFFYCFHFFS